MKKEILFRKRIRAELVLLLAAVLFLIPFLIAKAGDDDAYIFSKEEDAIYHTLIDRGYSVAGVCGILGNISVENPQFEPDLSANNGNTYGLFQWTDVGNRKSFLKRWCNNRILHYNRMEGQIAYAIYELEGGDPQASRVNSYLKTATDPEEAAMEFAAGFERCVGATSNSQADGVYTGTVYTECVGRTYQGLSRRMENARTYYDGYFGTEVQAEETLDLEGVPTVGIVAEREAKMEQDLQKKMFVIEERNKKVLMGYRVLCVVVGYLFGCVLGISLIIRRVNQKEALHMEKRLPSLLEVFRYVGIKESILAALIDIAKIYLALILTYYLTKGALESEQILLVGIGIVLGNAFPFWNRFRGGMGIVVTIVFICTYMPIWGYICILAGLIVALWTKSLPFGAICVCIFSIPYAFFCKGIEAGIVITVAILILCYKHYRFLTKFIDRELIHAHYQKRRNPKRSFR